MLKRHMKIKNMHLLLIMLDYLFLYNYGGIYMDTDVEIIKNIDVFFRQ